MALQVAVDAPKVVSSLALFDPSLLAVVNPQQYIEVVGPSVERYRAGDRMAAVDGFFSSVWGRGSG